MCAFVFFCFVDFSNIGLHVCYYLTVHMVCGSVCICCHARAMM